MAYSKNRDAAAIAVELASTQHSVLLGRQLARAGVSHKVAERLRIEGWLRPAGPKGAYVVGAMEPSPWQRLFAVWLAAGPDAVVSHFTAARLHRMPCWTEGQEVEISVPTARHPRVHGGIVHRMADLGPGEVTEFRSLFITTPLRTLLDVAARLPRDLLAKVVDEGMINRLWTAERLEAALNSTAGRSGVEDLRQVVRTRSRMGGIESELERSVQHALRSFRPFETQYQISLDGQLFLLDIAWPELKVAVECDGWTVRSRARGKFDHDRRRNNLLVTHGWIVVHVTTGMSDEEIVRSVFRAISSRAANG